MFNFDEEYVYNAVLDNKFIEWTQLYEYLGISGILKYKDAYDVKNIFCSNALIDKIQNQMKSNVKSLRKSEWPKPLKSLLIYKPEYRERHLSFLLANYAPTVNEDINGLAFIL